MRCARLVFAAALCGLALPVASARAADPVIVSQPLQGWVAGLNGNLVYPLKATKGEPFVCMRRVGGKLLRAHLSREGCGASGMGLDRRGRVIQVYSVYAGQGVPARWYAYDLKSDRTRRVSGLPGGGCIVRGLAIWRRRTVYAAKCPSTQRSGVWAKVGKKTTRIVASTDFTNFVLRGGTLAGIDGADGEGEFDVYQLMVDGKRCVRAIESAQDTSENEEVGGFWIANEQIVWARGYYPGDPQQSYAGLFTAKVPSHCAAPGPNGRFNFYPETTDLSWFTLDGRKVYYADGKGIRRHTLPAEPTYAPPANDNFENATSLAVGTSLPGRTAWATPQSGEPLANREQTIWYTFTPAKSETLSVSAQRAYPSRSVLRFGVFTGPGLATLTPVGSSSPQFGSIEFNAVAGRKYWVDVGSSDAQASYMPLYVSVTRRLGPFARDLRFTARPPR
jgi:hypothetical protein